MRNYEREVSLYVDRFRYYRKIDVASYVIAGQTIIEAKKYLKQNGQVQAFYDACDISRTQAHYLTSIARSPSILAYVEGELGVNIETESGIVIVPLPKELDLSFRELKNVPVVESKIAKGELKVKDLEDLLHGVRSYDEIMGRTKGTGISEEIREVLREEAAARRKAEEEVERLREEVAKLKNQLREVEESAREIYEEYITLAGRI